MKTYRGEKDSCWQPKQGKIKEQAVSATHGRYTADSARNLPARSSSSTIQPSWKPSHKLTKLIQEVYNWSSAESYPQLITISHTTFSAEATIFTLAPKSQQSDRNSLAVGKWHSKEKNCGISHFCSIHITSKNVILPCQINLVWHTYQGK